MEERIKLIINGDDKYLLPDEVQKKFSELEELLKIEKSNSDAWYKRYMTEWNEKMEAFKAMRLLLSTGERLFAPYTKQLSTIEG